MTGSFLFNLECGFHHTEAQTDTDPKNKTFKKGLNTQQQTQALYRTSFFSCFNGVSRNKKKSKEKYRNRTDMQRNMVNASQTRTYEEYDSGAQLAPPTERKWTSVNPSENPSLHTTTRSGESVTVTILQLPHTRHTTFLVWAASSVQRVWYFYSLRKRIWKVVCGLQTILATKMTRRVCGLYVGDPLISTRLLMSSNQMTKVLITKIEMYTLASFLIYTPPSV